MMDVDSTLIQEEVIELLADQVGKMQEVKEITDRTMAGELDFTESLTSRVSLLAGLPVTVFDELRPKIHFTPGVLELIATIQSSGGKVGAVSGGFSQVLDGLAKEAGLDYSMANELEVQDGKLTGKVLGQVIDAEAKAKALINWAEDCGIDFESTVAIGDGANDIQMLKQAGIAIAFRPKPVLREHASIVIEENSLLGVLEKLGLSAS